MHRGDVAARELAEWAMRCEDALAVMDMDGALIAGNDALARLLGCAGGSLVGRPLGELLDRAGATAAGEIAAQLLDPACAVVEVLLRGDDGATRHIQAMATRWRDGEAVRVGLRLADRTAQRAAEEELTQLASFPELDPTPIVELGPDSEITYMNAAGEALQASGTLAALLAGIGEPGPDEAANRLVREVECDDRWYEIDVHAISSWSCTRIYARDITRRKRAERAADEARRDLERRVEERTRELAAANERLRFEIAERQQAEAAAVQASQVKSTFLARMSHELRTPLNAIIGYAEIVQESGPDSEHHDDAGRILGAARHLLGLINDILDISKIEAGRMDVVIESLAVEAALRDAADTVRPLIEAGRNALRLEWSADELGRFPVDAMKLRQILLNLLGNAAKFTQGGVITLRCVRLREPSRLRLTVEDTGIGISPEAQARLFRPFVQADPTTSQTYGGSGLGLALCREYCRLLGGTITVDSAVGRGSAFVVTLPEPAPGVHAGRSGP